MCALEVLEAWVSVKLGPPMRRTHRAASHAAGDRPVPTLPSDDHGEGEGRRASSSILQLPRERPIMAKGSLLV